MIGLSVSVRLLTKSHLLYQNILPRLREVNDELVFKALLIIFVPSGPMLLTGHDRIIYIPQ